MGIRFIDRLADIESEPEMYQGGDGQMIRLSPYDLDSGERDAWSKRTSELWLVLETKKRRQAA